jgi:hypothetical protein
MAQQVVFTTLEILLWKTVRLGTLLLSRLFNAYMSMF